MHTAANILVHFVLGKFRSACQYKYLKFLLGLVLGTSILARAMDSSGCRISGAILCHEILWKLARPLLDSPFTGYPVQPSFLPIELHRITDKKVFVEFNIIIFYWNDISVLSTFSPAEYILQHFCRSD